MIVGIDAGEIAGLSYFAMEYVEGKTLQRLVKERGPMDERQALEIIIQVAKALEHAEKHSLVHRDIKPDNIMVTRERVAKLLDLGLAKMRVEGDVGQAKGMAVGTPNYISPEQAMGRSDIDTRADIYSLGVTLFYVLTGRVPFEGAGATACTGQSRNSRAPAWHKLPLGQPGGPGHRKIGGFRPDAGPPPRTPKHP